MKPGRVRRVVLLGWLEAREYRCRVMPVRARMTRERVVGMVDLGEWLFGRMRTVWRSRVFGVYGGSGWLGGFLWLLCGARVGEGGGEDNGDGSGGGNFGEWTPVGGSDSMFVQATEKGCDIHSEIVGRYT